MSKIRFNYIIGNPPYQVPKENTSDNPIYHEFMDMAYRVGEKVELITPARFLFNAGKTPKEWNEKMLNDSHLKILDYQQNSSNVFTNTDIKGGLVVSYRDKTRTYSKIDTFVPIEELNSILKKVAYKTPKDDMGIGNIIYLQNKFQPGFIKEGKERRLVSSIFDTMSELFYDAVPRNMDVEDYIQIIGRQKKRTNKWVKREYVEDNGNLNKYKVILPAANGSGAIGEALSTPLIGSPLIGYTQTFIGIGSFDSLSEAENCMKYIKSKFCRTMLGIKKVTQDNKTKETWSKIPLQDFTSSSDIDWSKSIPEIDKQLYAKYNLTPDEIEFIEKNVKPME